MSFSSMPKSEIPAYDLRTATRPQTTHAVVRLLQGIRRTEENTGVAHCEWRTDRIPHSGEFLQGEASTKESACHVLCGERGRSRDFGHCPNHYRPRSEEHTSELQSHSDLVCRLLLEKKKKKNKQQRAHKARKT